MKTKDNVNRKLTGIIMALILFALLFVQFLLK